MTIDEQEILLDRLSALAEYFDKPKSAAQLSIYVQALNDLPLAAVLQATNTIVKDSTFFPKVAELRSLVEGNDGDAAELAWMGLLREVRRTGYTGIPDLPPATLETVRGLWGGWVTLCQTLPGEGPELLGWAKRFGAAYVATRHRLDRPELIGRDEAAQLYRTITEQLSEGDERTVPALSERVSVARDVHGRHGRQGDI